MKPCRPGAAVGNTRYVHVARPRYAPASCLYRSLSFMNPPYRTCLLRCRCVRVLLDRIIGRKCRDLWNSNLVTNPSRRLRPQGQSFYGIPGNVFEDVLPTSQIIDTRQHTESTTLRV